MRVIWLDDALDGMKAIHTYIAIENPLAAYETLIKIKAMADMLADFPLMGKTGRIKGVRELVINGTSYILPYRIKKDTIEILNVFHEARNWPEQF